MSRRDIGHDVSKPKGAEHGKQYTPFDTAFGLLILTCVLVEKMKVGVNKIVEGGPSTPPRLKMLHLNATWYQDA
jgi:hypothetical protein